MPDDSATNPEETRPLIHRNWISVLVVVTCSIVLLAVIIPGVNRARLAAQKTQSKNNLKQIGLALWNYHCVYESFPLGCDTRPDGIANHGWMFRIVPYLESSSLYSQINMNLPWDHPINEHRFRRPFPGFLNPTFEAKYDADGHALTHYLGNPNILHRNHSVSKDDMTTGAENNWLAGEISGRFQPYAYPFNWRELTLPFEDGQGSYGGGAGDQSVQLCLGDGSVRTLFGATDQAVINALATAPPNATEEQKELPDQTFAVNSDSDWTQQYLLAAGEEDYRHKGSDGTEIFFDPAGLAHTADIYSRPDGAPIFSHDGSRRIDLQGMGEAHPELRTIIHSGPLDDTAVSQIVKFKQLQVLLVTEFQLTAESRSRLAAALPTLRICLPSGREFSTVDIPVKIEN